MGACPSSMKVPLIGWLMIFGSLASVVLILLASADGEVTLVDTSATKAAAEEPAIFNLEINKERLLPFRREGFIMAQDAHGGDYGKTGVLCKK